MNDKRPDSPGDFSDSDRAWFAALSGQAGEATSPAAREGAALRVALEQQHHETADDALIAEATSDEAMQHMQARLLQQADALGLFAEAAPPARPATPPAAPPSAQVLPFPWWRRGRPMLALAASVLVAVVLVQQYLGRPDYPVPPMTAGAAEVADVRSTTPRQAAERLAAALKQAGLRPGLYQDGRAYLVDVQLQDSELSAATVPFAGVGLKPGIGFNRIRFQTP